MNRRPRRTAILLLALMFVVGGLTGMALEEGLGIDWFDMLEQEDDDAEDRLLDGLDLTADQRERADEILERQEDRLEDYWESRLPEIRNILQEGYAEIRDMLTTEQREVFDRRIRELEGRVPEEVRD